MKNGFLGSMAALVTVAGLAMAQAPRPYADPSVPQQLNVQAMPSTPTADVPQGAPRPTGSSQPTIVSGPEVVPGQPPIWIPPWTGPDPNIKNPPQVPTYGPGPVPYRLWFDTDYLLWFVKSSQVSVPLATTDTAAGIGGLSSPTASLLLGSSHLDYPAHSGYKSDAGIWLDEGGHVGIEVSSFFLETRGTSASVSSDMNGNPLIAQPVINALTGMETANLVTYPGLMSGGMVESSSNRVWGSELNLIGSLYRGRYLTFDMIGGFRYVGYDEDLTVQTASNVLAGGVAAFNGQFVPAGNTLLITDRFSTRNDFFGGQVGAKSEFRFSRFYLDLTAKVAFGATDELVRNAGSTSMLGPDGSLEGALPGGFLVLPSNSGSSRQMAFSILPEAGAKIGVHVTDHLSAYVAYNYLYWFNTVRPGDQIDRTINPNQVPSNLAYGSAAIPARPGVPMQQTDFWVQGINLGIEVRY